MELENEETEDERNCYPFRKRARPSSDSDSDTESDIDDLGASTTFLDDLGRAFERNWKEECRRPKKRQGRNRESRKRARRVGKELKFLNPKYDVCEECGREDFVEDSASGDVICSECGLVQSSQGLGFSAHVQMRYTNKSKRYARVVHFRQRLAQMLLKDPLIEEPTWSEIEKRILSDPNLDREHFGKKAFSQVLKEMMPKIPKEKLERRKLKGKKPPTNPYKRLSANWIQVRSRLGFGILPPSLENEEYYYERLCARYQCIDHVFQEKLWDEKGERRSEQGLKRRNIINVNYIMVQLLRLESEELFQLWGKFFPQLTSKRQPKINNRRWEILMVECARRYASFAIPKTGEIIKFSWEFKELTLEEIGKTCSFFF